MAPKIKKIMHSQTCKGRWWKCDQKQSITWPYSTSKYYYQNEKYGKLLNSGDNYAACCTFSALHCHNDYCHPSFAFFQRNTLHMIEISNHCSHRLLIGLAIAHCFMIPTTSEVQES